VSWIDKIQTDFIITTGDGKSFKVNWLNASKAIEFNVAVFDFPNLSGTLVKRGTAKGRKFALEIYFQGEDHLDQALDFEISANDSRSWTIAHPFYGTLTVEPTDLFFDHSKYNVSKVTGNVIETITEDTPKASFNSIDKITADNDVLNETFANSFVTNVKPNAKDISALTKNNAALYNEGKKSIKTALDAEKYFNFFNEANSAILKATSFPLDAIRKLQTLINYPGLFIDGVKNRIRTMVNQFKKLRDSLQVIKNRATRSDKKIYENNAGILVSSLAVASVTNIDYKNRNDVLEVIALLTNTHNSYLEDLDSLQTDNGGTLESYVPDVDSIIALNNLINFTVSNLFAIAIDSKQERSVLLEDDTSIILLAHRFYGLKADDSTIQYLIDTNNLGLNELLTIKKGRKIVYYV
jgi:hypothetical protein